MALVTLGRISLEISGPRIVGLSLFVNFYVYERCLLYQAYRTLRIYNLEVYQKKMSGNKQGVYELILLHQPSIIKDIALEKDRHPRKPREKKYPACSFRKTSFNHESCRVVRKECFFVLLHVINLGQFDKYLQMTENTRIDTRT